MIKSNIHQRALLVLAADRPLFSAQLVFSPPPVSGIIEVFTFEVFTLFDSP